MTKEERDLKIRYYKNLKYYCERQAAWIAQCKVDNKPVQTVQKEQFKLEQARKEVKDLLKRLNDDYDKQNRN